MANLGWSDEARQRRVIDGLREAAGVENDPAERPGVERVTLEEFRQDIGARERRG